MNDVVAFTLFTIYVGFLLWAVAAISRRMDRYYARRQGVKR
ncbi:hypothetical protein ACFYVK_35025 [Streptomyces chartreusis]